ncbi:TetR family transcriptional regulator [Nocardiopsis sp. NPDC049922]|uniref:TetR/AcrR family transcriptional regulator n=1 Tax=Nocardiopsis sp. NPDC049922 TaxID=3155157 RepID=UPI0034007DFE
MSSAPQSTTPTVPLHERRRRATRLEIARAAAALFARDGVDQTTAEDIARASGVALRTFYRYFRTKQDAVAPLLLAGADRWRARLAELLDALTGGGTAGEHARSAPAHDLVEALAVSVAETMAEGDDGGPEGLEWTRSLLRAAESDEALRDVWYRVNRQSEERLAEVLEGWPGFGDDPVAHRLAAAAATDAVRLSIERWAATDAPPEGDDGPAALVDRCLRMLAAGVFSS